MQEVAAAGSTVGSDGSSSHPTSSNASASTQAGNASTGTAAGKRRAKKPEEKVAAAHCRFAWRWWVDYECVFDWEGHDGKVQPMAWVEFYCPVHKGHGPSCSEAKGTRRWYAPHLSKEAQEWLRAYILTHPHASPQDVIEANEERLLSSSQYKSPEAVMRALVQEKDPQLSRDYFMTEKDVEAAMTKLDSSVYKLHKNECISMQRAVKASEGELIQLHCQAQVG
jgi:hypothetical protein